MSHHLRGTSDAFAEKRLHKRAGKGTGNYGRWPQVSTSCAPRVVVLDQPLVPRALYGNYEAPRFVLPLVFGLFAAIVRRQSGPLAEIQTRLRHRDHS